MTCIKLCFSLVFLVIFATVFADDCKKILKEKCEKCNLVELIVTLFKCFDGERCIKDQKTQSPECKTCLADNIFGLENPWCKCVLAAHHVDREIVNDDKKIENAVKRIMGYVLLTCGEAVGTLKPLAEPGHEAEVAKMLEECNIEP